MTMKRKMIAATKISLLIVTPTARLPPPPSLPVEGWPGCDIGDKNWTLLWNNIKRSNKGEREEGFG